ncbi:NADH-quinone oxidoreductase subunit D [Desulfuromonas thiophila]|jgi:NADH-quinone oxidoreductase subunit D|uniref:NADH-quinone oxidoreductase subunit D n=1 Tax=Desulfuromonas thiophila TaxID=57664 RepID=A0A1G7DEM3_9BACT|nr:NADH-quinone oxidoreductase subunit D [Desulfuromonas thiophila]MDD3802320.1 NADH-quinone oxidoreductase subunit D [Desulfuromonas thiophila]MDY0398725.1 NADH-quinone oxidoreductase subunit D [Desulfuromonas thiophila]SDE49971.1 NADH dehydrogenase subunit D [Desulfuromonas thiophila]
MNTDVLQDERHHRFILNMGPQHPSTHGVLRVLLEMEGEYVTELEPVLGYGHRCHEKIAEYKPAKSFMPNTARMDYLGALIYNHGYAQLLERAAGIEVPRRAEFIRVIVSELNRVQSHLLWLGAYLLDLGAFTPIMYSFDDREQILDILEDITGSRLTYCYMRVGGVCKDIDDKFVSRTRAFIDRLRSRYPIYEELVNGNIILQKRLKEVGDYTPELCARYGVTGPLLRGTGVAYDLRRAEPYSIYPEFDFEIPTETRGDSWASYNVRYREIEQSLRIIEQALDKLPEGEFLAAKVPKKLKLPAGDYNSSVEAPRGELSYYLVSDGSDVPYRLKVRTPSYSNLSVVPEMCQGMLIADVVTSMGALDLVIPEIDR